MKSTSIFAFFLSLVVAVAARAEEGQDPQCLSPNVIVTLEGARGSVLEMETTDGWRVACRFPCATPVARGATYRLNGPGMKASEPFLLTARERVTLVVDSARTAPIALGIAGVAFGGIAMLVAVGTAVSDVRLFCEPAPGDRSGSSCSSGTHGGTAAGLAIGGVALALAGIVGIVAGGRTHTEVAAYADGAPRKPAAPSFHLGPEFGPTPEPMLTGRAAAPARERGPTPSDPPALPVLSGVF